MTTVRTQTELDAALTARESQIVIDSPRGVWLHISQYDTATVRAAGSATVEAYGSATVEAYGSATVQAGKYVAVHPHSKTVTITGGVIIDITDIDKHTPETWCDWQGIDITNGTVTVYKAVDEQGLSGYCFAYPVGKTVTAPDWAPTDACGAGLHFGATPHHASYYYNGVSPRFLACQVNVADMVGITGSPAATAKCKAKSCVVLYEVDVHGRKIEATP